MNHYGSSLPKLKFICSTAIFLATAFSTAVDQVSAQCPLDQKLSGLSALGSDTPPSTLFDNFGKVVVNIGDADGDGVNDFAVSSSKDLGSANPDASVSVWSGKTKTIITKITSKDSKRILGQSLLAIGDLNGDGHADLLISEKPNEANAALTGKVHAYSIVPNKLIYTALPQVTATASGYSSFGQSLASLGDLNADGKAEFVVGADEYVNSLTPGVKGAAAIFDGNTGKIVNAISFTNPEISSFAHKLHTISDLNQDGFRELVVSATYEASDLAKRGVLLFYSGAAIYKTSFKGYIGSLLPDDALPNFGYAVQDVGDLNGNKLSEIAISSPDLQSGTTGDVIVASPTLLQGTLNFETILNIPPPSDSNTNFGFSLALAKDLNGDSFPELAISSPDFTQGGLVEFFTLKDGLLLSTLSDSETTSSDNFGTSIANLGDLNNDGFEDLAVSTPKDAGALFIFTISSDRNNNGTPDLCELSVSVTGEDLTPTFNRVVSFAESSIAFARIAKKKMPKKAGYAALLSIEKNVIEIEKLLAEKPKLLEFNSAFSANTIADLKLNLKKLKAMKKKNIKRNLPWKTLIASLRKLYS